MEYQVWGPETQKRLKGLDYLGLKVLYRAVGDVVHLVESQDMPLLWTLNWAKDRYQKSFTDRMLDIKTVEALVRSLYPKDYFLKKSRSKFAQTKLGRQLVRAERIHRQIDRGFIHAIAEDSRRGNLMGETRILPLDLMIGKQLRDKHSGDIVTIVGYEYAEGEIFEDVQNGYPISVPVTKIIVQTKINVRAGVPIDREFEPYPKEG